MSETIIFLTLILLTAALLLWIIRHRKNNKSGLRKEEGKAEMTSQSGPTHTESNADGECCGLHAVCEKKQQLKTLKTKEWYFNDEELDRFRGTAAADYTDEQTEEFREVLYTMRPVEVPEWVRCLQFREVELPEALREEVLIFMQKK